MIFTSDQLNAINAIKRGKNVVITGPGGTGKTAVINHISKIREELIQSMGVTAMTGAAAVIINGRTLHSYLGIGLGKDSENELVRKINVYVNLKKKWCDTNILIIDEISMLSSNLFDKLNNVAKRVRCRSEAFGGMQLVLGGDFLQLPCINGSFCFKAETWDECNFTVIHFTKIMRQLNNEFQECLNRARFGEISEKDIEYITQNDLTKEKINTMEIKPTRILCRNVDVNDINTAKLERLPSEEIYRYKYNVETIHCKYTHLFKDITKICNAMPELLLSIGAQVMLLANIDPVNKLVNGSRGVVTSFKSNGVKLLPVVKFMNLETIIEIHKYEITDTNNQVIGAVFQIPLKLAYAITVHKSQGMTLDSAIINLKGVFEYGQAYVALSRVKEIENLFVKNITKASFKAHPDALEFYRELKN